MARRSRFIDSKSTTSLGASVILNTNGVLDPRFAVSSLLIKNTITLGATASGDLSAGDVGLTRIEALWESLNTPFLNNVTYQTLDLWSSRHWHPATQEFDVLADQAATGGGSFSFDFIVPVKRQNAARPADYCVALSEFGQITVQIPSALTAGDFTSWQVDVYAIGDDVKPGEYIAGSLQRVDELTGESGNVVDLRCYGHKVADLFGYTSNSGSPISGNTSPRVEFDGREIVNFRGLSSAQLPYAWGDFKSVDAFSAFVDKTSSNGYSNTLLEDLVPAGYLQKISHMESVSTCQVFYNARISDTSHQRYALTTLYPSQAPAQLAQRVPGGSAAGADAVEAISTTPAANGGAAGGGMDSAYLPKVVNT